MAKTGSPKIIKKVLRDIPLKREGLSCTLAVVDFSQVKLNPRNSNDMDKAVYDGMVEEVKADGVLVSTPWVWVSPDGEYFVGDGEHRMEAAKEAGIKEGTAFIIEGLSEREANARALGYNKRIGMNDPARLADQLKFILDVDATDAVELEAAVALTGFSVSELEVVTAYDEDGFKRPDTKKLTDDFEDSAPDGGKKKAKGNENWFYVEFYEDRERFVELSAWLTDHLISGSPHELEPEIFYAAMKKYFEED